MVTVDQIKKTFNPGSKIMLIEMDDKYVKLQRGDKGTIIAVDDVGTIHVRWDNGLTLGLIYGEDKFQVI